MAKLKNGIDWTLEEAANEILREHLAPLPRSQKTDVLTDWKEQNRKSKEVYAFGGQVDPAIRRGMYHRVWNREQPHLNSRDGYTRPRRITMTDDDSSYGDDH